MNSMELAIQIGLALLAAEFSDEKLAGRDVDEGQASRIVRPANGC